MQTRYGEGWNIGERYEALKFMCPGNSGPCIQALDKITNELVRVQKLHKIENFLDAQRVLRGLRILRIFQHENIIELRNVIFSQDPKDAGEIYLITNLMEMDLYVVLRCHQLLIDLHIQFIIYQIVRALLYLHSANVVHSRLRPENILASENCDMQLCEFGLAQKIVFDSDSHYQIQENKYYQAPEMIVSDKYSIAVDMWSVGCILAELITGETLFKGENYIQQICCIVEILGKPKDLSFVTKADARKFIANLPEAPKRPLLSIVRYDDEDALDLLLKLLEIDPRKRITAAEAIVHPYLRYFHEPTDEPVLTEELGLKFEDDQKLMLEETLLAIMDEVNYWKKQNNENEVDEDKFSELLKSLCSMNSQDSDLSQDEEKTK